MTTAVPVALAVLAAAGVIVFLARALKRSAILSFREDEVRKVSKIRQMQTDIDEQMEKDISALGGADGDPRRMWMRHKTKLPRVSQAGPPGNSLS
ncbi:MAG: hypothetical protein HZA02_03215 [Nitrospinae bacterium]|nr:hypothetical protein [Nitrospinota bacterium]